MSTGAEKLFLGKRKGKDNALFAEEGAIAIGGQSKKKATRVVGNEGDDDKEEEEEKVAIGGQDEDEDEDDENDKEEEEKRICDICSSKTHWCRACPWNKRVPLDFVPEVNKRWMVVCKTCGIERKHTDPNKLCTCGYHGKYVTQKRCVACFEIGHRSHKDTACTFFGTTGVRHPNYEKVDSEFVKRMLKDLGVDTLDPAN